MAARGDAIVRRRPRRLLVFTAVLAALAAAIAYFLQPAQLTALILARAGAALKLDLQTRGAGSYALRPEPRLVLPGLSARMPGASKPFFRSGQIELALPWSTLRGKGSDVSRIVIKAPDIDLHGLDAWLAKQPPSAAPFKLPTLTRGLAIIDGSVHGDGWQVRNLRLDIPSLGDGAALALEARGRIERQPTHSNFDLRATAAAATGTGLGLRLDGLNLALRGDGELPSLTASGHVLAADRLDVALRGNLQSVPQRWAAWTDSSLGKADATPFSLDLSHRPPGSAGQDPTGWHLAVTAGDGNRQPLLTLTAFVRGELLLDAGLTAQLSRWPDAWPQLPEALTTQTAPFRFQASYQGPIYPLLPVAFSLRHGATALQGKARVAELKAWLRHRQAAILPPLQASLVTPAVDIGAVRLRGVRIELDDDPPTAPAAAP